MSRPALVLLELLEQEHSHILSGNISALEALAAEKIEMVEALRITQTQRTELNKVRHLLQRNHILMTEAHKGFRDVSMHLKEMITLSDCFASYSKHGERRLARIDTKRRLNKRQ